VFSRWVTRRRTVSLENRFIEPCIANDSSSKFGWLIPRQVILSAAKDLDNQGDSSLRSE